MMEARLSVVGDDPIRGLESLGDWLVAEPQFAGRVRQAGPVPKVGELGALADAVVVAVGSGGVLPVLATSLKAWLSQPRGSVYRVRIEGESGRIVEIDAQRVDACQMEDLLRQIVNGQN